MAKPRLHIVATVTHCFETFLAGQPRELARAFDITLVSEPGRVLDLAGLREGVATHGVRMTRRMTPLRDFVALIQLYRLFASTRPDIVQTYTPKAGLLAMTAAYLARVPVRVHGIIGMPLMEASGIRAAVLTLSEKATYAAATDLTCNSLRLRDWIRASLSRRQISVIGRGSINGVDTYRLQPLHPGERALRRRELGLAESECVFLFVGRLVRDKGVEELVAAFRLIHAADPQTRLLVVGDFEDGPNAVSHTTRSQIGSEGAIKHLGWRSDVRSLYGCADVLVLPSYREGMPNVVLEAAAMALPVVATDINGCNEIVHHGESGLLVAPKDVSGLAESMYSLRDPERRAKMGSIGRAIVKTRYDHSTFCLYLTHYYRRLLAQDR